MRRDPQTQQAEGLPRSLRADRSIRFAVLALLVSVAAMSLSATAFAAGGSTIASAPVLSNGVTVSGDTATDTTVIKHSLASLPVCTKDEELWTLNLVAGEHVLLKGQTQSPGGGFVVQAIPPGGSEAALLGTSPISGVQAGNLGEGLSFAAARSGAWLIVVGPSCDGGTDGTYEFSPTDTPPAFPAGHGGGSTIASAPALSNGVTVSGNTAADQTITRSLAALPVCTKDEELWTLNLVAGEHVLLKGQTEEPGRGFIVQAIPPGVSEATLLGTSPISGVQAGNLGEGLSFAAARSGTWLIVVGPSCDGGSDGPYQISPTDTPPAFPAGLGGGSTIASAPALSNGVTVSGNTAADRVIAHPLAALPVCTKDEELWTLNLVAGEHVLLKGQTEEPGRGFIVQAIPPGVSEATLLGTSPISGVEQRNLDEGLSFTIARSGTWLITIGPSCDGGTDGPYQLTEQGPRPLISPRSTRLHLRGRRVLIPVKCSRSACSGSVQLTERVVRRQRRGHRTIVSRKTELLATGVFSLSPGKSQTLVLSLTSAGRRLLAHAARHPVTARLTLTVKGGNTSTSTAVVT